MIGVTLWPLRENVNRDGQENVYIMSTYTTRVEGVG